MRSRHYFMFVAVLLMAARFTSAQQGGLVCTGAPAGKPCDAFHYHVQMYRPDTKQFVDVNAGAPYATQAACERAREIQVSANQAVVEFFRVTKEQRQYEADRVGPCHCDMTSDRSSQSYLPEAQRVMQLRNAEETRLRVRERLLDNKLASDSPLIRGLYADPPGTPLLSAPKLVPLPQAAPVAPATSTEDLRATKTIDTARPAVVALDLPLIEIGSEPAPVAAPPAAEPPAVTAAETTQEPQIAETVVEVPAAPNLDPQPSVSTTNDAPAVEQNNEDSLNAQETAERFISYETQRITNVLKASSAINDENLKTKIFEACMQRIQLLSNLRLIIEGSGTRSRLAAATRAAESEAERLEVIGKLFGEEIKPHWAPQDAADVIFEIEEEIAAAPERALRDTTGRFSADQKKRALYLVLAQSQPTEDQRLWLSTVVEGFLR